MILHRRKQKHNKNIGYEIQKNVYPKVSYKYKFNTFKLLKRVIGLFIFFGKKNDEE